MIVGGSVKFAKVVSGAVVAFAAFIALGGTAAAVPSGDTGVVMWQADHAPYPG